MPKKLTQEQIDKKQMLAQRIQQLHSEIMSFCTGRPPRRAINGSYQEALDYKDAVCKARRLSSRTDVPLGTLERRAELLAEKVKVFRKLV
jgi:hypothetical protein